MSKTRTTTRTEGIADPAAFNETIDSICTLSTEMRQATSEMDARIQAIRDEYEVEITARKKKIASLEKSAVVYAALHRDSVLDKGTRSGTTSLGRFGFRLGQPTLALQSRKITWGDVVNAIASRGAEMVAKYLVMAEPKPNKEAIKASMPAVELAGLGLQISQTDSFYVEPFDNTDKVIKS